jgi:FMN-dependent NADH-azoreductase
MMSKLLYIEASPLKSRSHSITVSQAFLDAYRAAHPQDEIERLDLWQVAMPQFDAQTIEAKFAVLRRNDFTAEQLERWEAVRRVSRHFNSADKYVFSVPMWNFGVPYVLKHYIDVVTLPGENWTWSAGAGYRTLLSGKKALAIYASANLHEQAGEDADDFQKPFMRRWLRFIGVEDIEEITLAPTLSDPESVARIRAEAIAAATQVALQF